VQFGVGEGVPYARLMEHYTTAGAADPDHRSDEARQRYSVNGPPIDLPLVFESELITQNGS
jgi:hypothetical protein